MAITCGYCGASMPDISEFCPSCGRPVREGTYFAPDPEAPEDAVSGEEAANDSVRVAHPPVNWNDRWVGALAYLTFIPAVAFIFLEQFRERKFVRFHAFQSIFFWAGVVVFGLLGMLASTFGWLLVWMIIGAVVTLALFFTWAVLSIKALQGEWFELPYLGTLAGQQAGL